MKANWKKKEEFQILSPKTIQWILEEEAKEGWIELEVLLPKAYLTYLLRVLNGNRHHRYFSYPFIRSRVLTELDVYRILRRQLCSFTKDGKPCFEKVKLIKFQEKWFLYLRYQS